MLQKVSSSRIAVVGAGLAGLAAARKLHRAGYAVTVFDKGRGLGGRMATRRTEGPFVFDHGAQFFTARSQTFQAELEQMAAASRWQPEIADGVTLESEGWWVGQPAMNALPKAFADGLSVTTGTRIVSIDYASEGWRLQTEDGEQAGPFDGLVLAIPSVQAQDLLEGKDDGLAAELSRVEVDPCWAVMAGFNIALELEYDLYADALADVAWIAVNGSKPGRPVQGTSLVLHASPEWSRTHLELEPDQIAPLVLAQAEKQIGLRLPPPDYLTAHRWRYAKTRVPAGKPFLASGDLPLLLCGDWCLGARVEYAFESGIAAADAVIAQAG
ncbi:hypothetical protein JM93_01923 [Roseibium hamelinense]|uniref:Amine oxidase domain-containing protein n=1 Tax=Roseibium hamelinense TaxID=150831 RepID=A0A562T7U4_9HYPH|nr:FAD-dependent oxidoreductase [Roseibium hamelinense]MTI43490.1 FAD-dependent oxidoreductase [Roseibium hamelinense]TWI89717.1 hypothetical protein JM93_01923 [Roseibium hamelinense]